ncbi:MAG: lysine--tRNA ligase [Candidatus Omnitrophica bacterium]|nr:lysine--tRNA ligase [Candidatus Omnitrophota bacterium]MDD5610113.1 lysine--tRNA ligase [Candidatus Omnitrophota bacterium]
MELSEIIKQRKEKVSALKQKGIEPFGRGLSGRIPIQEARENFQEGKAVLLAGRLMAKRQHGKACFADLKDSTAKIQVYVKEDLIGKEKFDFFQDLDIGDIVAMQGELFKTHTQELTIKLTDLALLSKSLRPLPEKWHGLKDVEIRYRQRYLDIISSDEVKTIFQRRSQIISGIRRFFDERDYLEVETPMMHTVAGGAAGRPFKTFHNEYNMDLYLRIAPELYLKELLVAGLDRVYEINRSFRNEGVSTKHNPEFTMLEVYTAYADYEDMMRLCEELIPKLAEDILGTTSIQYQGKEIELKGPWPRISFAGVIKEKFDINPDDSSEVMLAKLKKAGRDVPEGKLTRSQVVKIVEDVLEEGMNFNPVFFTDYFTHLCPLAKTKKDNPLISERFELFIAGFEIANAYSELNDPIEQKRRFIEELEDLPTEEQKSVDEDYVLALEHAMPPAGGLGIGIDRLVMLLTNQASIRDVILFPLLRK